MYVEILEGSHLPFRIMLKLPDAIDDIGYIMGGDWGRNILGAALVLCKWNTIPPFVTVADAASDFVPISGSGMLAISIAFNAMSTHGTCTAVFVVVAALLTFVVSSIRTLNRMSWLAWAGCLSILFAGEKWLHRILPVLQISQLIGDSIHHDDCGRSTRPPCGSSEDWSMGQESHHYGYPYLCLCWLHSWRHHLYSGRDPCVVSIYQWRSPAAQHR